MATCTSHLLTGLRMSDDAVCTAIGLRVGAPLCLPHTFSSCGKQANEFGRPGLSCRSSQGRTSRHQMLSNIIHHRLVYTGPMGIVPMVNHGPLVTWEIPGVGCHLRRHLFRFL